MKWSRLSIGQKLFALTGGVLLVAIMLMGAVLFQATRRASLEIAAERLDAVTRDLAAMVSANAPQRLDTAAGLGRVPAVVAAARGAAPELPDTLRALLAGTRQMVSIELLDAGLQRRAHLGQTLPPLDSAAARALVALARRRGAGIGPLRLAHDSVYYATVIAAGGAAEPAGYMLLWRRIASSPQARQRLEALVGSGAGLYFGNAAGDVWTDLERAVAGPPAAELARGGLLDYERPGTGRMLGRSRAIETTPWVVLVEFPRRVVLAPARRFLLIEIAVGGLLVLVGGLAAWRIGRRITVPLQELTRATEAIASGQQSARVTSDREDEVGRLASAFNVMAGQVERSRADLERAADELRRLNAELEERVVQRTHELQAANGELESFSYSVSHDLRAPLRAIDGFARLLAEDHGPALGEEGRRLLGVIRTSTQRMGHLIDDLLAFSKMGRQALTKSAVDLSSLAQEVVSEARQAEPARTVEVEVGTLGTGYGDRAMLRHVLGNLVQNAFKFTRTTAHPHITIGARKGRGETVFFVEDNGVGFDSRYVSKLFGVFQRLHRPEDFEGTGVGLAIVQRIVHRHGGRVWAEGTPGGGATFYFTLPHEEAAA